MSDAPTAPDDPRFLGADEVSRALSVSRSTAYKLMRQMGRVVAGRVVRVSREAFERWLAEHHRPAEKPTRSKRAAHADEEQQRQLRLGFARK